MKPIAHNIGGSNRGRPTEPAIVATHANICTPLGMATMRLAAEKKLATTRGTPVANMWCTQSPKLMKLVATMAATTSWYAAISRCVNAEITIETIPVAGMNTM